MNASASLGAHASSPQEDLSAIYEFATQLVSRQLDSKTMNAQQLDALSVLANQQIAAASEIVSRELEKATSSLPPTASNLDATSSHPDLPKLPAPLGPVSLDVLMSALTFSSRRASAKAGIESLEAKGQQQKDVNNELLAKMKENMDKLKEKGALEAWLPILKVVAIIVAVVAAVGAATAAVCTAGAALPVAAAVVGVLLSGDTILGMATDGKYCLAEGITAACVACGMDHEVAGKVALGIEIAICVATIALGVGAARAGAKAAAVTASKVAVKVAAQQAAKEAAKLAAEETVKVAVKAATEAAVKSAAEEAAKAVAEETAKKLAAEAAKGAAKEVLEKAVREAAEAAAKAAAKTAAKQAAELAAKETAELATKEVAEKIAKDVGKKVAEEVSRTVSETVANTINKGGTKVAKEATAAAVKEAGELAAKEAAREAAELAAKEAAKGAVEAAIEAVTKQGVKSLATESAKNAVKQTVETAARNAAKKIAEQILEQSTKLAAEKVAEIAAARAPLAVRLAATTQVVATGVGGINTVAEGGLTAALAYKEKDIADIRVGQKELEAILEALKSASEMEQAMIRAQLELDSDLMDKVTQIVRQNNDTQAAILSNSPSMA